MMQVQIPLGTEPGQSMQVQAPSGAIVQVQIPPGVVPGTTISIQLPPGMEASADEEIEAYTPMEDKTFDVTNTFESVCQLINCPCLGWTSKTLVMLDQEVLYRQKNLCGVNTQRRPYAQLGSVDKHTTPCGCSAIVSDFAPLNEKGEGGMQPGCCGEADLVEAVVQELQMRKTKRGGIAQIKKLDHVLTKISKLGTKVPLLLSSLKIDFPRRPAPCFTKEPLTQKEIDVTNNIEQICGCTTKTLVLTPEEARLQVNGLCHSITVNREYGSLGFVQKKKSCVCCFSVMSDISPVEGQGVMAPGCPCSNRTKVTAIVRELRDRMAVRGQVGQIKKQERILHMISDLEEDMTRLTNGLNLQFPPPQEFMKGRSPPPGFGSGPIQKETNAFEDKEYDVTNTVDSCMTCFFSCGAAGWTTETVRLTPEYMYVTTKNNIDDSDIKIPYAEIDSVDVEKSCCCCWSVNEQSPGVGCSGSEVRALAEDLQERKLKRGNVAHLRQLRGMQRTALELDVRADLVLESQGVAWPPGQQAMRDVFGARPPRVLQSATGPPHIEVEKEFGTKSYDVTNYCDSICACLCSLGARGWRRTTMELGPDEMFVQTQDNCMRTQSRTPYGNLGAVETETCCCCCSQLPELATPGCGCSADKVGEIAAELQERKVLRGNIAQMRQQENIIEEVLNLEAKVDVLLHRREISFPPTQEMMAACFLPAEAATAGAVNA